MFFKYFTKYGQNRYRVKGAKIAAKDRIRLTELIKSLIIYVDKFSKMSHSKKKTKSLK